MNRQQRRAAASDRRRNRQRSNVSPLASPPAALFRECCTQCSGPVSWVTGPAAFDVVGPDRLTDLLGTMPPDLRAVAREHGQFWLCDRAECGEVGVMIDSPW